MFEIELKAHVDDAQKVTQKLDSFAHFLKSVQKVDVYWKSQNGVQARIRTQTDLISKKREIFLTYKKKENRIGENGQKIEVNDEKECSISDDDALVSFFEDIGMKIALKKTKSVRSYAFENAHLELCEVPPLGFFLEIEIISEQNDEKTISICRKKINEIFEKCEIGADKIEEKYYSQLLREAKNV